MIHSFCISEQARGISRQCSDAALGCYLAQHSVWEAFASRAAEQARSLAREHARVGHHHPLRRLARIAPALLDLLDNVHSFQNLPRSATSAGALWRLCDEVKSAGQGRAARNLAEDDVLAVEVASAARRDEELRAIAVGAGVGHGQQALARVLDLERLVLEASAVDRLPAGPVTPCEVASLDLRPRRAAK